MLNFSHAILIIMNLTNEEQEILAQMQKNMDDGNQPFVYIGEIKTPLLDDELSYFNLESGQTVDLSMMVNINSRRLEIAQQLIKEQNEIVND